MSKPSLTPTMSESGDTLRVYASPCDAAGQAISMHGENLDQMQLLAERTLGRPLVDPVLFIANCRQRGLGEALNAEQDRVDELDVTPRRTS